MSLKLLVSGDRSTFTTLLFDVNEKQLSVIGNYPAPYNASWVEVFRSRGGKDTLLGLSEGDNDGLLYIFEIDHARQEYKLTSQKPTLAAPGHFSLLRDGSAVALGTYLGGSVALYPISASSDTHIALQDLTRSEICPEFPYASVKTGPVEARQKQCHPHQVIEDKQGLLYASDLGADRVWILSREGSSLSVCGWLQCPPGTGSRHAVFNHNESIMYVIGELSHNIVAFDLHEAPRADIRPIEGFAPNIIPPEVPKHHQGLMDSAELCVHPKIKNVLYASNRWQRHIAQREPHLADVPANLPPGDTVTIILLSANGRAVTGIRYVKSGLDVIRGMRISADGKFAAVVGQEGGGVEIYEVSGSNGEIWELAGGLSTGLEAGIKHAVWLPNDFSI